MEVLVNKETTSKFTLESDLELHEHDFLNKLSEFGILYGEPKLSGSNSGAK